jgi:hypothetical protein
VSDRYIALAGSVVGSLAKWEMSWYWDGAQFDERADAIARGFTYNRSDDFSIGVVDTRTGRLRAILWMDEDDREQDDDELREANKQLGFTR